MPPITGDHFAFSAIPVPHAYRLVLRLAFHETQCSMDAYGVTTFRNTNMRAGRGLSMQRRIMTSAWFHPPGNPPIRSLYERDSTLNSDLRSVHIDAVFESSLMLPLSALALAPHPLVAESFGFPSRVGLPFPAGTFPSASDPRITPDACDGGLCWLNSRFISEQFKCCDFVSHGEEYAKDTAESAP